MKKASEVLIQGKTFTLSDMEAAFPNMKGVKKLIIRARGRGLSFFEVAPEYIRSFTDSVIISIAAITGAELPESDLLANSLSKEVEVLLNDFGYSDLTLEEVLLAVRLNYSSSFKNPYGTDFEIGVAGNRVNVAFLSVVLNNYKTYRDFMDIEFENKIKSKL